MEWPWLGKFNLFFDIQKAPERKKPEYCSLSTLTGYYLDETVTTFPKSRANK